MWNEKNENGPKDVVAVSILPTHRVTGQMYRNIYIYFLEGVTRSEMAC